MFLDLSSAFDTVEHAEPHHTLDDEEIRGTPLNLVKDYLTGRKQVVQIYDVINTKRK